MIPADSSVVIDRLHLPSLPTRRIIGSHQPVICGVTVTEVLTGVRTDVERQKTMRQLAVFGRVPVDEQVWESAGRVGAALDARGSRIPFQDLILISPSIHLGIPAWTQDAQFERVLAVAPEGVLFDEATA